MAIDQFEFTSSLAIHPFGAIHQFNFHGLSSLVAGPAKAQCNSWPSHQEQLVDDERNGRGGFGGATTGVGQNQLG